MRSPMLASVLVLFSAFSCAAQSTGSGTQTQPEPTKPAPGSQPQTQGSTGAVKAPADENDQTKKKPKRVWTNEEMSGVHGTISVVGDADTVSRKRNSDSESRNDNGAGRQSVVASYGEKLRKLREQQDDIDKKIGEYRNFKADNSSPSGGINIQKGYSMTPVEDRVRQLEEKKKQIQAKIEAIEEEARKNGIEPGEIR